MGFNVSNVGSQQALRFSNVSSLKVSSARLSSGQKLTASPSDDAASITPPQKKGVNLATDGGIQVRSDAANVDISATGVSLSNNTTNANNTANANATETTGEVTATDAGKINKGAIVDIDFAKESMSKLDIKINISANLMNAASQTNDAAIQRMLRG